MTLRPRRDEAGAAVVDFVLVMLLLMPLVLGILQLAIVLHVRNTLASAAGEGARFAAVAGSTPELGEAKAREQIVAALGRRFAGDVEITPASVGGAPGYRARIVADVPVLGIAGTLVTVTVSGRAVAEQP